MKEPSCRIARWLGILAPYDFEIQYRQGNKQSHCDAHSRCPSPKECNCDDVDMTEALKCGPCRKCRRRAEFMVPRQTQNGTESIVAESISDLCTDRTLEAADVAVNGNGDDVEQIKGITVDDAQIPSSSRILEPTLQRQKLKKPRRMMQMLGLFSERCELL
ncbi:hypothetical protein DPMN_031906 [Dreissena polymorpha]|uniref:Uncharacterized protein n=1 Tax=Dreissena polymorpha TaxID=45954 RepID=A0A9D4RHR4_DREPO|nr:hypothetical protein DPMN_031906 [Dreissena polymorpha]